ncbi:hypothetical protein BKA81DRAFT_359369 [Phyllosticta paracitricarpa]
MGQDGGAVVWWSRLGGACEKRKTGVCQWQCDGSWGPCEGRDEGLCEIKRVASRVKTPRPIGRIRERHHHRQPASTRPRPHHQAWGWRGQCVCWFAAA